MLPVSHFACEIENCGVDRKKEQRNNRGEGEGERGAGNVSWRLVCTPPPQRSENGSMHVRYCDGFTSGPREEGRQGGREAAARHFIS